MSEVDTACDAIDAAIAELSRLRKVNAALVEAIKHISAVYDGIWVKMSDGEMELCRAAWRRVDDALASAQPAKEE